MRKLIFGWIFCSCCFVSAAQAETLTLRQALVLGMEHNFDLRVSSLDVQRADAGIRNMFSDRCFRCHGPDRISREADLRLDKSESVFAKRNEQHLGAQ